MATKTKKAKKITVTPLDDRIVVLPDSADERTESGIYLPEAAKEKPQTGKVIAAGPGKLTDSGERGKLSVKKGDTVLFGKYAGSEVDIDGVEHKIMRESELLAIVEK
ncbi:MAG: co-chaperone GroES [Phycisphaeraceae bacterium]|jgi:chaperonin GroES